MAKKIEYGIIHKIWRPSKTRILQPKIWFVCIHMELDMSMACRHLKSLQSLSDTSIHTPKVNVMVMNGRLKSLSNHVNQHSNSWNKSISNFDPETSKSLHINHTNKPWDTAISKFDLEKSGVKVMDKVKSQGHIVYLVSNWCTSFHCTSIGPTIPEIRAIECLTLKKHIQNFG